MGGASNVPYKAELAAMDAEPHSKIIKKLITTMMKKTILKCDNEATVKISLSAVDLDTIYD